MARRLLHRDLVHIIATATSTSREDRAEWLTVASDPLTLAREAEPAHFTASALPLTSDGSAVCLVLHGRMGLWVQPGGHFEAEDASVGEAAQREMLEETGLGGVVAADPLALSRHPAPCGVGRWHLDFQMLAVTRPDPPIVSAESAEVAWFEVNQLPPDLAPGVAELVAAGVARLSRSGSRGSPSREG